MDLDLSAIHLDVTNKSHRFREAIKVHPGGSITLGFLTTVVKVPDLLGNGQDFAIGLPDIAVRITAPRKGSDPHPRIEFSDEAYSNGGRSGRAAHYWTDNAATRAALTTLVFCLPEVEAAVQKYVAMLAAGQTAQPKASAAVGLSPETAALIEALAQR